MSGVNSSIPLAFNPQPLGPNIGAAIANANSLVQLQQFQQQQKRANALRDILGAPDALDPTTGMPKTETISKVMSVDPEAGIKLGDHAVNMQTQQLNMSAARSKAGASQAQLLNDTFAPIVLQHEEAIKSGKVTQQQADMDSQKAWTEARDGLVKGGLVPPAMAQNIPSQWNYQDAKRRAMASDVYLTNVKEQDAREKGQREDRRLDQQAKTERDRDERTGTTVLQDADQRPIILKPNAGPGQPKATYLDGTPVPEEKLPGAHKMPSGASAASADQARAERMARFALEKRLNRALDPNNPEDKAALDQETQSLITKQATDKKPPSATNQDRQAVTNVVQSDYEKELGRPVNLNDPNEKAELDRRVIAAEDKRKADAGSKGTSAAASREADAKTLALEKFRQANGRDPVAGDEKDKTELAALTTAERQKATAMSGRNAVMVARGLTSAADAVSDIRNVVELPITLDRGIFGGRHQGPGLMAATKEILANEVTAEDAQAYNTAMAGLERSLGGLATGGLAVSDNVMNQFGKLMIVKGDTNLIKLRKIATMRQNVENGLDGLLSNPQLGGEQSKMIARLQDQVREAVPWTVHDVNKVEFSKDKNLTVGQFAKARGVDPSGVMGTGGDWKDHPIPPDAIQQLKAAPNTAAIFDQHFQSPGLAASILGTKAAPAAAAPAPAQQTPAPTQQPAATPPSAVTPPARAAAPIPLPANPKASDLADGQVYQTGKGPARWDASKQRFFPVGSQ